MISQDQIVETFGAIEIPKDCASVPGSAPGPSEF